MTIAPVLDQPKSAPEHAARVAFRQPISTSGFIDAAWWPRSLDLVVELPPLLDVLWTAGREITRVSYILRAWDPAPRRFTVGAHTVHLGGFNTGDPLLIKLIDSWGAERIDVLVLAPATAPDVATRAFDLASAADDPYTATEILTRAAEPAAATTGGSR
jgi:hypothetical protein